MNIHKYRIPGWGRAHDEYQKNFNLIKSNLNCNSLSYIKYRSTFSGFKREWKYSRESFGSATTAAAVGPIKLKAFEVEKALEGL